MLLLRDLHLITSKAQLSALPEKKLLINTINAHSYNNARYDSAFQEALLNGDALLPDGISIVMAAKMLKLEPQPQERVTGWDLFIFEMERMNKKAAEGKKPKVMFLGSSENVLSLIVKNASEIYPNIEVVTFSPPFKKVFSEEDSAVMVKAVNDAKPDVLFVGMTAPKQEKWSYNNIDKLDIDCHVCNVGAVFDFFAQTVKRAPEFWQSNGIEWLYRLISEPHRVWRRYMIGNVKFLYYLFKEYCF